MPNESNDEMTPLEKALADAFCQIWRVLKATDVELRAYKDAVQAMQSDDPAKVEYLNAYVASRRQSPDLQKMTNEKYARVLGTVLSGLRERLPQTDPIFEALQKLEKLP